MIPGMAVITTSVDEFDLRSPEGRTRFVGLVRAGLVAAVLVVAPAASAQVISNSGETQAQVQLGFNGLIAGSVQLTIVATGPTSLTGTASVAGPAHSVGTIDLGAFTTTRPNTAENSSGFRITSGTPGAVLAARLIATLSYNGTTTGSITVARRNLAGAAPDVPLANLRVASPPLTTWTSSLDGSQVPDAGQPGLDICTAAGAVTCVNGQTFEHELAIFVPDSQPTGPFTTVVLYTGTAP